ncbi:MAG: PspC domain-containing protein [Actinomycetota bacterium]|nr:PspC domain-containing protein [Actinomycetota bacterium]
MSDSEPASQLPKAPRAQPSFVPPEERLTRRRSGGLPWRSHQDRVFAGVAGGVAEWSDVPPVIVRMAFVVLTAASGLGLVAYVAGAVLLPVADRSVPRGERRMAALPKPGLERTVALALIVLGAALLLRNVGIWFGGDVVVPAVLAGAGLSIVWSRTDVERREAWRARLSTLPGDPLAHAGGRAFVVRMVVGGALLLAGVGAFAATAAPGDLGPVLIAALVTAVGLALLVGPWMARLWRDLATERRQRIRSEERAEVAAHLHDSVLQTLIMVQRNTATPREVAVLARRQERELRGWLYGAGRSSRDQGEAGGPTTLAGAVRAVASEVEELHDVSVELVMVGDAPLDPRTEALVQAVREALVNACRHSGVDEVSVYLEAEGETIEVYVRDRGRGFDPDQIAGDRHGVNESIRARVTRHGGTATITSELGEGTEVILEVPR